MSNSTTSVGIAAVPDGGPLAGDMTFLFARANAVANAAVNAALVEFDLKVRPYAVLALATSSARMNQREIAEYLRLDPSQVVSLVDTLQGRDLVVREPDPRDRRTNVVSATDAGARLHSRAAAAVAAVEEQLRSGWSDDERDALSTLLRRAAFPTD